MKVQHPQLWMVNYYGLSMVTSCGDGTCIGRPSKNKYPPPPPKKKHKTPLPRFTTSCNYLYWWKQSFNRLHNYRVKALRWELSLYQQNRLLDGLNFNFSGCLMQLRRFGIALGTRVHLEITRNMFARSINQLNCPYKGLISWCRW